MIIAEHLTCSKCKSTYTGFFKVTIDGDIICDDCEHKKMLTEPTIKYDNTELEQEMVVNYLEEDIKHLYPTIFNINEISIDQFLNDSGELDAYKLYYQGNDLDFCTYIRRKAYICLDYIDTNDSKELDFCIEIIKNYLNLRFKKLSNQELSDLNNKINSEKFSYITATLGEI